VIKPAIAKAFESTALGSQEVTTFAFGKGQFWKLPCSG